MIRHILSIALVFSFACSSESPKLSRDSAASLMKSADSLTAEVDMSRWTVDSSVSPVDGGVTIHASAWGRKPGEEIGSSLVPSLRITCERGRGEASFLSSAFRASNAGSDRQRAAVRWRFSGASPQMSTWPADLLGALFWPDEQAEFLRNLAKADTLHIEVTGSGQGMGTATFVLTGLRKALGSRVHGCLTAN